MTNKHFLCIVTPFLFLLLLLGYCAPKQNPLLNESGLAKRTYVGAINQLDSSIAVLDKAIMLDAPSGQIQQAFKEVRFAYKRIEFIAEYYNPYTAKSMNGPAIDEVEEDDPMQKIILPTGFQVLEELLFPIYNLSGKESALQQVGILKSCVNRLRLVEQTTVITDTHIFDAMRQQIFRIITLGISGFDSPIAFHSIPEAAASLQALHATSNLYQLALSVKSPQTASNLDTTFTSAIKYMQAHPDFDTFDRVNFITTFANPLTKLLLEAQKVLQIPVPGNLRPLSAEAETLFDSAAFNPTYYAPEPSSFITPQKVALGKMLFFDPILSGNASRSCASCHKPEKAFTDGQAKSIAFDFKGLVNRNAPTMLNAGLQRASFHDMRVTFLEDQATDVLINASEMHGSLSKALGDLEQSPEYLTLFQQAFAGDSVLLSEKNLKIAIATYIRSLTSLNSRFDKHMRGKKNMLTRAEKQGFNLFMGKAKCGTCHFMPLFNGTVPPDFDKTEAEILGVPSGTDTLHPELDMDLGKFALHSKDLHKFAFKTPTLRNIALTAPYMHNGVYNTLEEVIDFYNKGGGKGLGIDLPTQTLPADKLHLTLQEKKDLIAFMHSLTDTSGTTNIPRILPSFPKQAAFNSRRVGGKY